MFSKVLNLRPKTIGFRLTLWYSITFILSSLFLFTLSYLFLSQSIQQKDREVIQTELDEYIAQYNEGGTDALQKEVAFEKKLSGKNPFLVRLAGPENDTIFLNVPDKWERFDFQQLEHRDLKNKHQWFYLKTKGNKDILEVSLHRLSDGSVLQVGKSIAKRQKLLGRFNKIFAGTILVVVFVGLTGGIVFSFKTLRPIRHLLDTINSIINTSNINARVPSSRTGDELDKLSIAFNKMLERIEKLISDLKLGLDNVAHDLRTPIMRLRVNAEMTLRAEHTEDTLREALRVCIEEADQIATMLKTLMDITEAETGAMKLTMEKVNMVILIEDAVDLYGYLAEEKNISIHTRLPEELFLIGDCNRLRQVLSNLLDNAVKYTQSGGKIDVEAFQNQQNVTVILKDTGIGIPAEEIPKIWDRLYRGDKSRSEHGLGLGLCLVKAIIQSHKGHIEVTSQVGIGTSFAIQLPLQSSSLPS
jgi:signal transduction histidine kinase